jgi:hypothetical protein
MSSKLFRVSIAASSLFDPTIGCPQKARFVQVLARIGSPHKFPTSTGRRNVAWSLFDT